MNHPEKNMQGNEGLHALRHTQQETTSTDLIQEEHEVEHHETTRDAIQENSEHIGEGFFRTQCLANTF
ncbi:hypothetical protein TNCT_36131 [Trichonephila clavata]|uniref:Uncharacterized protein n=1 Tax=Trichonephila clavata TaxID=2740835 RepID=A0A8X6LKK5_TRICU|nr:hypothetical protein TNCT_36131 [Trichonephila clavata]